jgi:heat shock protein HtpX
VYEAIARNKRRSVLFIAAFVLLWLIAGALVGALLGATLRPPPAGNSMWSDHAVRTAAAAGVVIGAVVAGVGVLFSLVAGARLILSTSGATPATGDRYRPLRDLVDALAIGEGIPTPAVYVIEDPSPNAFSTGISPSRAAITYTTGLLELMNHEELEGVTGHEMSHIRNHDIRLLLIVGTLLGIAALLASALWRGAYWSAFLDDSGDGGSALVLVLFGASAVLALVGFVVGPLIRLALSRGREGLADVDGVDLTRNPTGLLSALKKLQHNELPFKGMNHVTAAMCIDDPLRHHRGWYHRLYDTHPPIEDRIRQLEVIASGLVV